MLRSYIKKFSIDHVAGVLRDAADHRYQQMLDRIKIQDDLLRVMYDDIKDMRDSLNATGRTYASAIGGALPIGAAPGSLDLGSTLCRQIHFATDEYRYWCKAIDEAPKLHRKQWEYFYVSQVLFERGMLRSGRQGLVFGVGREPLPALFASFGMEVLATDQSSVMAEVAGWQKTGEHSADAEVLNDRHLCETSEFNRLVKFSEVDMNAIPSGLSGRFDVCWSTCALEHLGSLRHGLDFIKASIATLKPGGVAVHTTEFNLSSNDGTVESPHLSIYRRRDIEAFLDEVRAEGHHVEPVEWTTGGGFADRIVDMPPYHENPHLRLQIGSYECTSLGLVITRGG